MPYKHNPKLTVNARNLRKDMTKEERRVWYDYIKHKPIKVLRQKVVENYILDFYYPPKKIAIELDGSQHYTADGMLKDEIRTEHIAQYGITVYRIPNNAVNWNFEGVCQYLDELFECWEYTE